MWGMGSRPPFSRGQALRGNDGRGCGKGGSQTAPAGEWGAGMALGGRGGLLRQRDSSPPLRWLGMTGGGREGMTWEGEGRFANRPYGGVGRWNDAWGGWVPGPVFTGAGSPREQRELGNDRGGKGGSGNAPTRGEDGSPHSRGQGRGGLEGEGLPVAAGFSGDDASKAWGGEVPRSDYDALLLKFCQSFPTRFDAKLG